MKFVIKLFNHIGDSAHNSVMTTYANACADRVTQGEITKKIGVHLNLFPIKTLTKVPQYVNI